MKKRNIILLVALGLLAMTSFAFAQAVNSTQIREQAQDKIQAQTKVIKTKTATVKCSIVEKRVSTRIKNFDSQRDKHLASYAKVKAIIENKISRLEDEGYDVSKVRTDLIQYDVLVEKFKTDYQTYANLLKEAQSYACGKEEGDFRAKLTEARAQLKVVHQDAVEIRTFWAKTIRPDFVALKSQKPVSENTDSATENTTETDQETTNQTGQEN